MSLKVHTGVVSHLNVGLGREINEKALEIALKLYGKIQWLQDYDKAIEKAAITSGDPKQGAQLVMALFTGSDWCPFCQALETEVFQAKDFRLWFNFHLMVPLMLDYPHKASQSDEIKVQNAKLMQQYNITGFPTVVAIKATPLYCTPNGGCVVSTSEVGRLVGYAPGSGAKSWIASFSAMAGIS